MLWEVLTLLWRLPDEYHRYSWWGDIPSTDTQEFLHQAILIIDGAFGDGYAKKNPVLLSSLLNARCREAWEVYE